MYMFQDISRADDMRNGVLPIIEKPFPTCNHSFTLQIQNTCEHNVAEGE